VVAAIRQGNADVIALQETNRESEGYLRRKLRAIYPHMTFRHSRRAGGFAFLSKVPLQNVTYMARSEGWYGTYLATVTLGGRKLRLANVHLLPTVPERGETMLDFLGRWRRDQKVRREEVESILDRIKSKLPLVLLGDFNSLPASSVADATKAARLIDSYEAVTPATEREHTWHWRLGGTTWYFRLDYIYHVAALTTKACRIVRGKGSDHELVVSTFAWTPPATASSDNVAPPEQTPQPHPASQESSPPDDTAEATATPARKES
jgi:endonuclease/exonuclease/phosphatase (EEP) superfamily protein YafD